jgi:hypothetical protein
MAASARREKNTSFPDVSCMGLERRANSKASIRLLGYKATRLQGFQAADLVTSDGILSLIYQTKNVIHVVESMTRVYFYHSDDPFVCNTALKVK